MKTVSKLLAGLAAVSMLSPITALASSKKAPACVNDKTIQAMQIRIAQTELMVAGLSCRQYDQWAPTSNIKRYNEFVTRYRPTLMDDGHKVLKKFFPTEQRLNDYLTQLANEAQLRGNANMAIFCTQASKIYDDVLNGGPVELAAYSASLPMAAQHGHNACNPAPLPVAAVAPSAPLAVPVASSAPAAASQTLAPSISSVIAANDPAASSSMQPVPDVSMRPAVKRPPTPMLKPSNL